MENITLISHNPISKHLNIFAIISCVSLMSPGRLSTLSTFCSLDKISVLLRCYVVIILAWARIEGGGEGKGLVTYLPYGGRMLFPEEIYMMDSKKDVFHGPNG